MVDSDAVGLYFFTQMFIYLLLLYSEVVYYFSRFPCICLCLAIFPSPRLQGQTLELFILGRKRLLQAQLCGLHVKELRKDLWQMLIGGALIQNLFFSSFSGVELSKNNLSEVVFGVRNSPPPANNKKAKRLL